MSPAEARARPSPLRAPAVQQPLLRRFRPGAGRPTRRSPLGFLGRGSLRPGQCACHAGGPRCGTMPQPALGPATLAVRAEGPEILPRPPGGPGGAIGAAGAGPRTARRRRQPRRLRSRRDRVVRRRPPALPRRSGLCRTANVLDGAWSWPSSSRRSPAARPFRSWTRLVARASGEPAPGPVGRPLRSPRPGAVLASTPYWRYPRLRSGAPACRPSSASSGRGQPGSRPARRWPASSARARLLSVPGIGQWTAAEGDAPTPSAIRTRSAWGDYNIPHHVCWALRRRAARDRRGGLLELLAPYARATGGRGGAGCLLRGRARGPAAARPAGCALRGRSARL